MPKPPEPSWPASASALLLCVAAGATDILSYLTLGQIFTSAMTGCAALFFVKSLGGQEAAAARAALALASYLAGCMLAAALQPAGDTRVKTPLTLRRLLAAESFLLAGYVLIALPPPHPAIGATRLVLIAMSATAMGVQSIVARDLSEPGISTVVLNPTMTSLGLALARFILGRTRPLPRPNRLQLLVLVAYAAGALTAALGVKAHLLETSLLPLLTVLAVLALTEFECRAARSRIANA